MPRAPPPSASVFVPSPFGLARLSLRRGRMSVLERSRMPQTDAPPPSHAADHVTPNLETIAGLRARAEQTIGRDQRAIERLTAQIGRPRSLCLILGMATMWTMCNG